MPKKLFHLFQTFVAIALLLVVALFSGEPRYRLEAMRLVDEASSHVVRAIASTRIGQILLLAFMPTGMDGMPNTASALDTAFQTQYRQEFIASFEQKQSLLRETVTTEAVIKGNTAIFLVVGSGGAEAVSRGVNGLIPARADDETQNSCTLSEWHDLVRKTSFNVFASQGNQREMMQMTTMAVLNRKIDSQIVSELGNGTVTIGGAGTQPTVSLFQNGRVKLSNASVPWDSNVTLLCQPSFLAYLEQAPEFTNAQYVDIRPYAGNTPSWRDKPMAYRWRNCLIIEHPNLPGKATTAEKSFLYHKSAIGQAANVGSMETPVGYNEEQAYSWARASMFMGAKLLQNSGVVVITHDGSAYA